jgi:hypothetical protein
MKLELNHEEKELVINSLLSRVYIAQRFPSPTPEVNKLMEKSCEDGWRLLERMTGKTRAQIAERDK